MIVRTTCQCFVVLLRWETLLLVQRCVAKFGLKKKRKLFGWLKLLLWSTNVTAFFLLGVAFDGGLGCEKDLNLAKENYLIAAELGHGFAADFYGRLLDESDPVHWIWFARAALRGCSDLFLGSFAKQVNLFFSGSGNAMVVFVIGCALKGNIDMEKKEIFALSLFIWNSLIGPANQAISFYGSQIKSARLAVDTWTLISTRLHVIKDMRMLIGKLIWEARFEANYKI